LTKIKQPTKQAQASKESKEIAKTEESKKEEMKKEESKKEEVDK